MGKPEIEIDYKKENAKLKRSLALTANKLHSVLNAMQPYVAESKDAVFIQAYETGRNHIRRNFKMETELKKKTKKGKVLSEDELYFESLPVGSEKPEKLFQMMRQTYILWHVQTLAKDFSFNFTTVEAAPPEWKPIWDGRQFGDLKKLENYFLKIAIHRGKKYLKSTGEQVTQEMIKNEANHSFYTLLTGLNSDRIEPYLRKQKKISQILYNLTNIIDQLKNGIPRNPNSDDRNRNAVSEAEQRIAMANGLG